MYKIPGLRYGSRLFTRILQTLEFKTFAASIRPPEVVYSGDRNLRPVTQRTISEKFRKGEPLTMVTAYDYPSAVHVENANIDLLLVGDSVAMVVHGYDTTIPITLDEMLIHCKAVVRGARRPLIVGDLPFGSYEASPTQAVHSAMRLMKEGQVDAVKMEGGDKSRIKTASALTEAGIAVMGHVGLTPQMISVLGGFRPQAQLASKAMETIHQAMELQKAGCFSIVLECVPASIGAAVQEALEIPVIGIGAGPACAGQVLVFHDLLGFVQHPHHRKVTPKFCKRFAEVGDLINSALTQFNVEVKSRTFPGAKYSPYAIEETELTAFCKELRDSGLEGAAVAAFEQFQATRDN